MSEVFPSGAIDRRPPRMASLEALRIGGLKTKKATVTEALNEYIQRRQQRRIVDLFGKVDIDPKYDYKAQRRR